MKQLLIDRFKVSPSFQEVFQYLVCTDSIESANDHWLIQTTLVEYNNFLKEPIKLEHFIPVDEEGNALNVPPRSSDWHFGILENWSDELGKEWNIYEKALEKVIYKGFELSGNHLIQKGVLGFYFLEDVINGRLTHTDMIGKEISSEYWNHLI